MGSRIHFDKIIRASTLIILLTVLILPAHAPAATVVTPPPSPSIPLKDEVSYKIYWNGIRSGKLWLYWEESDTAYRAQMQMKTSGLVRIFTKQLRKATVEGTKSCSAAVCTYTPVRAHWDVKYKHKSRSVDIAYDAKGNVIHATVTPPDNRASRPDVPQESKNQSVDALTATQHLFFGVMSGMEDIAFKVYDGRRFTEYRFELHDKEKSLYSASRKPLGGYSDKEQKEFEKGDPPILMQIIPAHRFPIAATAKTSLGQVRVIPAD